MIIGYQLHDKTKSAVFMSSGKKNSIQEVMDLIKERYVDTEKVDSVSQIVIDNLLSHLDPHSVYIPAKYLTDANQDLLGNFQGIGIERIFSVHSPVLQNIEIIRRAKVRRAKLYYLRDRVGKATRLKARATESNR